MKYQRLKSIDGSGTIMRYYKIEEPALCNAFYGVTDGVATKIDGAVGEGVQIIGFSHGGDNLAKGLVFLDINPAIVYMGILEDDEDNRPNIGDVVNGYQSVIDTHYDGDAGVNGKNDDLFGVETLDNPYYLFTIVEPEGTEFASTIPDGDAGEFSGKGEGNNMVVITFNTQGGAPVPPVQIIPKGGKATAPATDPVLEDETFSKWSADGGETEVDFDNDTFTENTTITAIYAS